MAALMAAGMEISITSSRATATSWWLKPKRDSAMAMGATGSGSRIRTLVTSPGRTSRANNM